MKNTLFMILIIILIVLAVVSGFVINNQKEMKITANANREIEQYTEREIKGSELMTLINKVSDYNEKKEVQKDDKNRYIENNDNSIKIEVKFLESDDTYDMEAISKLGSEAFIKNYNSMVFECIKKEYHKSKGQIKYMLFKQK